MAASYQSAPAAQPTFVPHAYDDASVEVAHGQETLTGEHVEVEHHGIVPRDGEPGDEVLLAAPLGASVMSAFEALAATVVLQNAPMLEGIMRDLLRPMVKTWLDDNLPPLVERLVRVEIERVARGTRG